MNKKFLLNFMVIVSVAAIAVYIYRQKQQQIVTPPSIAEKAVIERVSTSEFGDLADIKKRRMLRVLVAYSKTNFFFDGPEIKGFDYEIMREYEKFLNANAESESDKVVVTFIVKPFNEILEALIDGKGDIAVANLTVTPEREKTVQFAKPYIFDVSKLVVHNKSLSGLELGESLSGKSVYLLPDSRFIGHFNRLNNMLKTKKLPLINIRQVDNDFSTEDILKLVNASPYSLTVVDDFIAKAWQRVLPNLVVRDDLSLGKNRKIAWAVRKNSDQLLDSLSEFAELVKQGSKLGNIFYRRYYENSRWIDNPSLFNKVSKLKKYRPVFQKYAAQYNFDWLSVAAIAFQESRLDQSKVSPMGAIGIMQIKPDTAASDEVGIPDIDNSENNINAGIRYLAYLRENFFTSDEIAPEDQIDFTWAAYNAGPGRIKKFRQLASEQGYDPNKWFSNVERIAAREIGRETVQYVANINKYYIAYKLAENNF